MFVSIWMTWWGKVAVQRRWKALIWRERQDKKGEAYWGPAAHKKLQSMFLSFWQGKDKLYERWSCLLMSIVPSVGKTKNQISKAPDEWVLHCYVIIHSTQVASPGFSTNTITFVVTYWMNKLGQIYHVLQSIIVQILKNQWYGMVLQKANRSVESQSSPPVLCKQKDTLFSNVT